MGWSEVRGGATTTTRRGQGRMADLRTDVRNDADMAVSVATPDPKNVQELTQYVSAHSASSHVKLFSSTTGRTETTQNNPPSVLSADACFGQVTMPTSDILLIRINSKVVDIGLQASK